MKINLNSLESTCTNITTDQVDLHVEDTRHDMSYPLKGVLVRGKLHISMDSLVTPGEVAMWPHLCGIWDELCLPDADLSNEVHLLIGLDQLDILPPREVCRGVLCSQYATLTGLGWTLNGPCAAGQVTVSANFVKSEDALERIVEKFWKLDSTPCVQDDVFSIADQQVLDVWSREVCKEELHYVLPIPFKQQPPQLPNNFKNGQAPTESLG